MITILLITLLAASLFYIYWLRRRMTVSKAYFSLMTFIVAAISPALTTPLVVLNLSIDNIYITLTLFNIDTQQENILTNLVGNIDDTQRLLVSIMLGFLIVVSIYKFGNRAIQSWQAPKRLSEARLVAQSLESNMVTLSVEQFKLIIQRKPDPIVNDSIDWRNRTIDPPAIVETKDLLKDMFVSMINEIKIDDDAWYDEGSFWLGTKRGLKTEVQILALIFGSYPNRKSLKNRLNQLENKLGDLQSYDIYALYMSRGSTQGGPNEIKVNGKNVEIYGSKDLIINSLDLIHYAHTLISEFENQTLGGTKTKLKDSFVDLNITYTDLNNNGAVKGEIGKKNSLSSSMRRWLNDSSREQIVLTGEYGQGKSMALLKFCYDWAKGFVETEKITERIPLLIELRGKSPSEMSPSDFLALWCKRYKLDPDQVFNLIKSGNAVVIFEGFDELRNVGDAFHRHEHFQALWRFAYQNTKIIFSGRPNFFLDQEEENRTLRHENAQKTAGGIYTSVWKLERFTKDQISQACQGYDDNISDGIIDSINKNNTFFDIASRPSMLPVLATIWKKIKASESKGGSLTSALLMDEYIEVMFSRKEIELEVDEKRHDAPKGSRYLPFPKQVREFLNICVAWRMAGIKAKNTISRKEISDMVEEIYDDLMILSKSDSVPPEITREMADFEEKFKLQDYKKRIDSITTDICRAGLLVRDEAAGSTNLRYPHKQFFEFLIAKSAAIKSNRETFLSATVITKSSPEKNTLQHLLPELNSIVYLVDCAGFDIARFFSIWRRFGLFSFIQNIIISNKINMILRRGLSLWSKNKHREVDNSFLQLAVGISYAPTTTHLIFAIPFLFVYPILMFSLLFDIFLIPVLNPASFLGETNFLLILVTSVAGVTTVASLSLFSSFYREGMRFLIIFHRLHWRKNECYPDSSFDKTALQKLTPEELERKEVTIEELHLISKSLLSGKVQFNAPGIIEEDIKRFLYPALDSKRHNNPS